MAVASGLTILVRTLEFYIKVSTLPNIYSLLRLYSPEALEQHGLCRVISYIVQSLSAEKAFGAKLSSPIKAQLPPKWNTMGNAGHFLVNVGTVFASEAIYAAYTRLRHRLCTT